MKIGVSSGDLNGIGIECFVNAINNLDKDYKFFLYVNKANLKQYLSMCNNMPYYKFENNYLLIKDYKIEIIDVGKYYNIEFGKISKEAGENSYQSIIQCTQDCIDNKTEMIITLPITKESCYLAGMDFPGHTELLAKMCGVDSPLMILFYKQFRVALQTVHIPVKDVPKNIKTNSIIAKTKQFADSLTNDFGTNSKIAILGLNPHSGEGGNIGNEEIDEIIPAINELKAGGFFVEGPFPADGFFGHSLHNNYAGVLSMYHDQGLVALKLASQGRGVNFTANLPIVRTSPDHGSGLNIAGQGIADYHSTLEAIYEAINISRSRKIKEILKVI